MLMIDEVVMKLCKCSITDVVISWMMNEINSFFNWILVYEFYIYLNASVLNNYYCTINIVQ